MAALITAVDTLYENMDQSLRFQPVAAVATPAASTDVSTITIDREADFQGVTCPLNYVKTKLLLGQMKSGQVLSVLLDEAGGRSVPQSAAKDGHEILSAEKLGDRWRVILRKA